MAILIQTISERNVQQYVTLEYSFFSMKYKLVIKLLEANLVSYQKYKIFTVSSGIMVIKTFFKKIYYRDQSLW